MVSLGKNSEPEKVVLDGKEKDVLSESFRFKQISEGKAQDVSEVLEKGSEGAVNYSILGNSIFINDINFSEKKAVKELLTKEMLNNGVEKLHFYPYLSTEKKRLIYDIIAENHPYMNIFRLPPDSNVVNVTLGGIKYLNDNLSPHFVDRFIENFKGYLTANLNRYSEEGKNNRLIRNDYKNMTVSSDSEDIKKEFFGEYQYKHELIEDVVSSMDSDIQDFCEDFQMDSEEVVDILREYFSFGVGFSSVEDRIDEESKIIPFYEAEVVSRKNIESEDIEIDEYDVDYIKEMAQSAMDMENQILTAREGGRFSFEGIEYDVVLEEKGEKFLNPVLLRYARKYCELSDDMNSKNLRNKVCNLISYLNKGFDFMYSYDHYQRNIDSVKKFDKDFRKSSLSAEAFIKNYKQSLSKDVFGEYIKGRSGCSMFIDIKDMGIQNIFSFRDIAEKVSKEETDPQELLKGGDEVTDRFLNVFNSIKSIFPEAVIALGGDEIYIFLEEYSDEDVHSFIKNTDYLLYSNDFQGRFSYDLSYGSQPEHDFEDLDYNTQILKEFEKKIDFFCSSGYSEEIFVPNSLCLVSNLPEGFDVETAKKILDEESFVNSLKKLALGYNDVYQVSKEGSGYTIFCKGEGNVLSFAVQENTKKVGG